MARLLGSVATVGGMTMISRLFGYARDMVWAMLFGASSALDAFLVAFRIPNFFRRLFAEGAFSQGFIPVFSEWRERRDAAALRDFIDHVAGALMLALFVVTAIGVVAAPWLIFVFAPGLAGTPDGALAGQMLAITFPYLLFISLTAMAGAMLNAVGRFAVPALTPLFLNLVLIAAAFAGAGYLDEPVLALAIGVFVAGVVQLLFQLPFLWREKLLPRPRWKRAHVGVRRVWRLMLPAIFGSSVVQINLLFDTLVASFLVAGSISWLYFGDRFVELPLAVIGIALSTVLLPRLSSQRARADAAGFQVSLAWALRVALIFAVPSTVGLIVLAVPILAALLAYNAFSAFDVQMAAIALAIYAAGLPAFVAIKVLAPGFFAHQDTRTPVRIAVIAMLANMLLNVAFVLPWLWSGLDGAHGGLAAATVASAYLNAALLARGLRKRGIWPATRAQDVARDETSREGLRGVLGLPWQVMVMLASTAMIVALWLAQPDWGAWYAWSAGRRIATLLGLVALGGGVYFGVFAALGGRLRRLMRPDS
ncbi:MAG: murein biosynthesis integral membrane protein MurJ [Thioalkalivibrionaceae bacterium]